MRLSSTGTRKSSSTSLRFLNNATKSSHHLMEGDCVSENSHPSLQLNIPHMNNSKTHQKNSMMPSFPQKKNHRRRSSDPATISTTAGNDEAAMLQYLNRQQRRKKKNTNPETWSVKLPAYHSMQKEPATKSKSRKSFPPPSSMFRGNASSVSPAALNSFGSVGDEEDWMAERREPFATIEEPNEKPKWKKWFSN